MSEQTKELEEKLSKMEEFVKAYYNVYLDSAIKNGEYAPISNNSQYFLYAKANELLGSPNGKKLDSEKKNFEYGSRE